MRKIFCDRCGKEITGEVFVLCRLSYTDPNGKDFDLCADCHTKCTNCKFRFGFKSEGDGCDIRKCIEESNENLRHDSYYYNEEDNVCGMNELGTIEIYQSGETGKIYLEFIIFDGEFPNNSVWTTTKEIFPEEFKKLENTLLELKDEEEE